MFNVAPLQSSMSLKGRFLLRSFLPVLLILAAMVPSLKAYAQSSTVTISGTVRFDANSNGLLDTGDTVKADATVMLFNDSMQSVSATVSSATGAFQFSNLAPGNYRLQAEGAYDVFPGAGASKVDYKTIRVTAPSAGTTYSNNIFLFAGPCECHHTETVSICGKVIQEQDCDGNMESGELGRGSVSLKLVNSGGVVIATATTDSNGNYCFNDLPTGTYTVQVTVPSGFTATNAVPGPGGTKVNVTTIRVAATTPTTTYKADFVICQPPVTPKIGLVKTADKSTVTAGGKVTYSYRVSNTGTVRLVNVVVVDDNATPTDKSDDFVAGTISVLNPGQVVTFSKTVIPPVRLCSPVGTSGQIVTQILPDGNIRITFIQDTSVNDNTYGVNSQGWKPNRPHTFKDLLNSDQATFSLTNNAGTEVLLFKVDYLSQTASVRFPSGTVNYPSGYGTLGVLGGDGGMLKGSASSILSATTSLTKNLNQSSAYYKVLVDSPAAGSALAANWDNVMRYSVVVSGSAFGTSGFGKAMIIDQHNSPGKFEAFVPKVCDSAATNTAKVTAKTDTGTAVSATAKATVTVTG